MANDAVVAGANLDRAGGIGGRRESRSGPPTPSSRAQGKGFARSPRPGEIEMGEARHGFKTRRTEVPASKNASRPRPHAAVFPLDGPQGASQVAIVAKGASRAVG